jgi:hypothetical protein
MKNLITKFPFTFLNIGFCSVLLIIALLFEELYPFTNSPMFRDNEYIYTRYFIMDSSGQIIPDHLLKLHQIYNGNPIGLGIGKKPYKSYNEYGKKLSEYEIISIINNQKDKLLKYKLPLIIEQVVYGPVKGTSEFSEIERKIIKINGE